jgi:hypothetical protein
VEEELERLRFQPFLRFYPDEKEGAVHVDIHKRFNPS